MKYSRKISIIAAVIMTLGLTAASSESWVIPNASASGEKLGCPSLLAPEGTLHTGREELYECLYIPGPPFSVMRKRIESGEKYSKTDQFSYDPAIRKSSSPTLRKHTFVPGPYWLKNHSYDIPRHLIYTKKHELAALNEEGPLQAEIQKQLALTYRIYAAQGIVEPEAIAKLKQVDDLLDPLRTTYITYQTRNGEPRFIVRLYDGSVSPQFSVIDIGMLTPLKNPTLSAPKLPIELEYPELILTQKYKLELGRGAKDPLALNDLHSIFDRAFGQIASAYMGIPWAEEVFVFAECVEDRLVWYLQEHGFEVIAGTKRPDLPKEVQSRITDDFQILKSRQSRENRYILRISKENFGNRNFEHVFVPLEGKAAH